MTGPRIPRLPEKQAHGTCRLAAHPPFVEAALDKRAASNVRRLWPEPAEQASANTGTIDPRAVELVRGIARLGELATECDHFREGYVSGHRAGALQGIFLGLVVGVALVAGALQAGLWIGGLS